MKLAIQTSSGDYALGLIDGTGQLVNAISRAPDTAAAKNIGTLYSALMQKAGKETSALTGVMVDLGPGGLSSTRAGVSFANALSYGANLTLTGVSALEATMLDAKRKTDRPILAMRPSPGGACFWAYYEAGHSVASGCEAPDQLFSRLATEGKAFALAGPLRRIGTEALRATAAEQIDIPAADLACFAKTTPILPITNGTLTYLEPITNMDGAHHIAAKDLAS
ncbi:hypothetical protein [Roseibium denhamense]|uniref:tRNA threonylcarbamoyl adenosine modification protein YeaZ n=1 Tax=Roseibium denhamense TaxID=76305 RepID=A0ABY1P5G2_9HYPH|nr:hypothetical protein [Roseibium denhamense]SMP26727.1 tRNA threonylcarbamoyl adenosine modification protein YeaZ [Roseibium denhamense]